MCKLVTGLFREVFDRPYVPDNPDDRVTIQKNTYLLEKLGVDVGDFWFLWDKYGPFSLELKNTVLNELDDTDDLVEYSDFAKEQINAVKRIIECGRALGLESRQWLELICSLHFLKNYVVADGDAISELTKRKSHFSDRIVNSKAIDIVNTIDTTGCYNEINYTA